MTGSHFAGVCKAVEKQLEKEGILFCLAANPTLW
jgi:hypothetical protein